MFRVLCRVCGGFLSLCGAAPIFYGIFNAGCGALCVLGVFFLVLPSLWEWLSSAQKLRTWLGAGISAFLLFCGIISCQMIYKAWFDGPPELERATVIVLGAKVNGNQPSLMLRRRLAIAGEYLEKYPEAVCIVTGGQGPVEEYPEAQVMAQYLENRGIEPERIIREENSASTRDNFRFGAELLRVSYPDRTSDPVIVVTDSFHQMRASIFASAAFDEAEEFYALSSYTPWGLMPSYWARDMFGIVVAWVQTR